MTPKLLYNRNNVLNIVCPVNFAPFCMSMWLDSWDLKISLNE